MKLTAQVVVRNELARYLEPCVTHLLEFCDEVVVLDDASDDGSREWLVEHPDQRLHVVTQSTSTFFVHEGRTRQLLLDETLAREPTHVLSIDADEFVSDGAALRAYIEANPDVTAATLSMEEVWRADRSLWVREDGGWRTHELPFLWRAPAVVADHGPQALDAAGADRGAARGRAREADGYRPASFRLDGSGDAAAAVRPLRDARRRPLSRVAASSFDPVVGREGGVAAPVVAGRGRVRRVARTILAGGSVIAHLFHRLFRVWSPWCSRCDADPEYAYWREQRRSAK